MAVQEEKIVLRDLLFWKSQFPWMPGFRTRGQLRVKRALALGALGLYVAAMFAYILTR